MIKSCLQHVVAVRLQILILGAMIGFMPFNLPLEAKAPKEVIPSYEQILEMEARCVDLINLERAKYGLVPLKVWDALTLVARKHSENMAIGSVAFGHDGFEDRADEINSICRYKQFAENVAYNHHYKDPLKVAVEGWMDSPGHFVNIVGDFLETGIGIAYSKDGRCYLSQLFATRRQKK